MVLTSLHFGELFVLGEVVAQVAARHDVDHQVEVLSVLESVVHVY